jgi:hypothetical protein
VGAAGPRPAIFVELYNPNDFGFEVPPGAGSSSAGYAVAKSDGTTLFTVAQGTPMEARGHYLACGNTYGLATYRPCDRSFNLGQDIGDNQGVAVFKSTDSANFTAPHRADAAGFVAETNALYKEGTGIPNLTGFSINEEWSLVRKYGTGVS